MSIAFGNKDNATGINTGISNSIEVILVDYINAESPAFKSVTKTIKDFQLIYENEDVNHAFTI